MTMEILFIFLIGLSGTHASSGDCSECGLGPSKTHHLIKNGKAITDAKSFPWLVSLRINNSNVCAAVILDESFILTAAHCVKRKNARKRKYDYKVHFQTKSKKRLSKGVSIEKIIAHPKYKEIDSKLITFAQYDIALLKLKKKIRCDMYKRPICLPSPDLKTPIDKENFIAGYGEGGKDNVLHYGTLKHLNFGKCIEAVPETKIIRDHALCLGGTNMTPCTGDSGGPLIDKINSKYTTVGIASAVTGESCPTNRPVIYTDVAKFVDWIKEEQKGLIKFHSSRGIKQRERERSHRIGCRKRKHKRHRNSRRRYRERMCRRQGYPRKTYRERTCRRQGCPRRK